MNAESRKKFEILLEKSKPYKALLYDVDGTLANNMAAHKAAYVAAAAVHGIDNLNDDIVQELAGWPTVDVAAEIGRRYERDIDVLAFARTKSGIFVEEFIQQTEPIDYVLQHLLEHVGKKKIGIVSGGSRATVSITLDVIKVTGKFETLVCAGETPEGKPSPQPFLLAAEQLGVAPKDCLVFEDGDPGVQGAIAAGMGWVRIDQI